MIRVYFALALLAVSGISLITTNVPFLKHVGAVELIAALVGPHAHFTHRKE